MHTSREPGWGLVVALIIKTIPVCTFLASPSDREKFGFSSLKFVFKEKQIFEVLRFVPLISLKENFTPFSESVKQMRTCKGLLELILGWVDSREAEGGAGS